MEVYGETGYVIAVNNTAMRLRKDTTEEKTIKVTAKDIPVYEDPFSYFADVLRGKITVAKNSLYSLDNNITVVQILEAARQSAKTGKTVYFTKNPNTF